MRSSAPLHDVFLIATDRLADSPTALMYSGGAYWQRVLGALYVVSYVC